MDRYNNIILRFEEYAALKQEVLFNNHKKKQSKGNK